MNSNFRKFSNYIVPSLLLLFLFNCTTSTKYSKEDKIMRIGDEYIPMNIGNKWVYSVKRYENNELLEDYKLQVEIIDYASIEYDNDSVNVFIFKESKDKQGDSPLYYLLNITNDGIYWWGHSVHGNNIGGNNDSYYYSKKVYIKYPPIIGDSWIHDYGDYSDRFEYIDTKDSVYVNDELFLCAKIRMGNPISWYIDYYYSKGVGLLKEIHVNIVNEKLDTTLEKILDENYLNNS